MARYGIHTAIKNPVSNRNQRLDCKKRVALQKYLIA